MKIGIISEPLNENLTGIGYYTFNLIKHLIKLDKENEYFLINWRENKFFPQLPKINLKNPLKAILPTHGWYLTISFQIRKKKLDLILNPQALTFFRFKSKHIITIFDLTPLIFPRTHRAGKSILFKFLLPKTLKYADKIITISENTKKDIIKYFDIPENKIKVIYLAADENFRIIHNEERLKQIQKEYKLPTKFILYVGTLEPRKNIVRLFMAYKKLYTKIKIPLIIVGGTGWKYKNIFKIYRELNLQDKVKFTGYVKENDLPVFYNLASLFVYPSLYEGFGLPVLEAMQCGCPVVTSNTSSSPEVAGGAAIKVNPLSVEEIEGAMYNMLTDDDLRREYIKRGLKQAKKFSWEKCTKETMALFKEVININL